MAKTRYELAVRRDLGRVQVFSDADGADDPLAEVDEQEACRRIVHFVEVDTELAVLRLERDNTLSLCEKTLREEIARLREQRDALLGACNDVLRRWGTYDFESVHDEGMIDEVRRAVRKAGGTG